MNSKIIVSIVLAFSIPLVYARNWVSSTKEATQSAVLDLNEDGWDDLWVALFAAVDTTKPELDSDGDGESNYREMLKFTNPFANDAASIRGVSEEINAGEEDLLQTTSDQEKRSRFLSEVETMLLSSADRRGKSRQSGGVSVAGMQAKSLRRPPGVEGPWIFAMEHLSDGQTLIGWEGVPNRTYDIEYSNDLGFWLPGEIDIPCVGGGGDLGGYEFCGKKIFSRATE